MINIAVVDDHPVFRQGLAQAIESAPDLRLVAEARSVEDLIVRVVTPPDVVLLDLHLPGGMERAEAVTYLCMRGFVVLAVSASEGESDVLDTLAAGACGYLTKQAEPGEIIRAVRAVAAGGTYVSATLAAFLLRAPIQLTEREKEILRLVASGETDQDIAEELTISVRTVRSHLDRIRDKTGHRRRADLTRLAIERGLATRPHGRSGSPRR